MGVRHGDRLAYLLLNLVLEKGESESQTSETIFSGKNSLSFGQFHKNKVHSNGTDLGDEKGRLP